MEKHRFLAIIGITVLAIFLAMPSICFSQWSDNFEGGTPQQTWETNAGDLGDSSSADFQNNRFELYTQNNDQSSSKSYACYVVDSAANAIIQARMQPISSPFLGGVMLRINGGNTGYAVLLAPDSALYLVKAVSGSNSTLGSGQYTPGEINLADCQIKFAVIGDTLYAKAWSSGNSEPAAWKIQHTDSPSLSAGSGGVVIGTGDGNPSYFSPSAVAFDDVSYTTDVCGHSITPASKIFDTPAGSGSVAVTAADFSVCDWTAVSNDAWIAVTSGLNYSGDDTVTYTVDANAGVTSRSGTMTIAGKTFYVYQAGTGGVLEWSEDFDGGTATETWVETNNTGSNGTANLANNRYEFYVEDPGAQLIYGVYKVATDCLFQGRIQRIDPDDNFNAMVVLRGDTEAGSGYIVIVNNGATPGINIYKSNGVDPATLLDSQSLAIDLSDFQLKFAAIGTSFYAKVWHYGSTEPDSWQVSATDSAYSIGGCGIGVLSGGTSAQVAFDDVSLTTDLSDLCTFTISSDMAQFDASGDSGSLDVTAYPSGSSACAWTATSDPWITITSGTPGSGDGTLNYTVTANAGAASRSGTMTIAGETFTVYQAGAGGALEWSENFNGGITTETWVQTNYTGSNGTATLINDRYEFHVEDVGAQLLYGVYKVATDSIFKGRVQQIQPTDDFYATVVLRGDTEAGTGYVVSVNNGAAPAISIFKSTGSGIPATLISSQSLSMDLSDFQLKFAAIGTGLYAKVWVNGTAEPNEWQLSTTDADYPVGGCAIGVMSGASSVAQVAFDDVSLTTDLSGLCSYSLSPSARTIGDGGGPGSVVVTAYPSGCSTCSWTATSNDPTWLTIDSGGSGTGDGTVNYTVVAKTGTTSRNGSLTIAGQTFTVKQMGQAIWTETFTGGYDQTWNFMDSFGDAGDIATHVINNNMCDLYALSFAGPADKHLTGYVTTDDVSDGVITATFHADAGDHFFAAVALRLDGVNQTGYGLGWNGYGFIWIGKRTAGGVGEPFVVKDISGSFDPRNCQVKFAAIGNKLFGKAWTIGDTEPDAWQLEFTDSDFTHGYAGIGVSTWLINSSYIKESRGSFDDVRLYDADSFWTDSDNSTGGEIVTGVPETLTAGDSEVEVTSSAAITQVISIAATDDVPFRYTSGIFGGNMINQQVKISSGLLDGEHKTVVKLHYTDADVAGIDEATLKLLYYNDVARSWRLAVSGNTTGTSTWKGDSPPTSTLGDYGVDTVNNILWAVVDHYSDFAAAKTIADGWSLQNNNTMIEDDSQPATTLAITHGNSYTWVADAPVASDTVYLDDTWLGQLNFSEIVASSDSFTVEVGYSTDGTTGGFVAGNPLGSFTGDGLARAYDFDTGADGILEISAGQYVALRVTSNAASNDYTLLTGGLRSFLNPPATCSFTLGASSQAVSACGGSYSVSVTAADTFCDWTAASNDLWITIDSGSSGTGDGTVEYSVSPHYSESARVGTMTIGGQTFTVNQAGAPGNWSDTFDSGTPTQTWSFVRFDGSGFGYTYVGENISLHTTSSGTEVNYTGYVEPTTDVSDAIIQARVQNISSGTGYLALRAAEDASKLNGYIFGIDNAGYASISKVTAGTATELSGKDLSSTVTTLLDCDLKFAIVGDKLFGKAWNHAASEPCEWQIEANDTDYGSGDAGVGVMTSAAGTVQAEFDNIIVTTDMTLFYQSGACDGSTISAGGSATVTSGGSSITVHSTSGQTHVISMSEVSGEPINPDRGLFSGGTLINKHVEVSCSLDDGDFTAVVKLHYTDGEISGINEIDLRLYYYDISSSSWRLAVEGNTTGGTSFKGDSAPTSTLGDYGVDTANNIVWAVVDHFTSFGSGGTGTGGWVLQNTLLAANTYLMLQGDSSKAASTVAMANGDVDIWVSGAPASVLTTFTNTPPGLGGQLEFNAVIAGGNYNLVLGSWTSGGGFVASAITGTVALGVGTTTYDMDALGTFPAGSFNVPAGSYLAMQITNSTGAAQTLLTGGLRSWMNGTNSSSTFPTVITLTSFTAEDTDTGVLLKWHTESEVDNAGFNIWRGTEKDGAYTKITDTLIPAKGSETVAADYEYTDDTAQAGTRYYYRLEDVDTNGAITMHGPITTPDGNGDNNTCFIDSLLGR